MRYLFALVLPPLAVLSIGRPLQAILNLGLTLFFWLPGAVHASLLVHDHYADQRAEKIASAVRGRA